MPHSDQHYVNLINQDAIFFAPLAARPAAARRRGRAALRRVPLAQAGSGGFAPPRRSRIAPCRRGLAGRERENTSGRESNIKNIY